MLTGQTSIQFNLGSQRITVKSTYCHLFFAMVNCYKLTVQYYEHTIALGDIVFNTVPSVADSVMLQIRRNLSCTSICMIDISKQ